MKDIKDYVCTLGQAEKLKELGIEQKSLFYYTRQHKTMIGLKIATKNNFEYLYEDKFTVGTHSLNMPCIYAGEIYSAFTSQELEELILKHSKYYPILTKISDENITKITLSRNKEEDFCASFMSSSSAKIYAEFLICLLENKK